MKDLKLNKSNSDLIFEEFIEEIDRGRLGLNTGLSTGIVSLDKTIGGIQKKTYNLVFAAEGVGKSVFVMHTHILYPIVQHYHMLEKDPEYKTDLKIRFYSLEVDRVNILGKMLCWLIYKDTGDLLSMNYLFSKNLYLIDNDTYELVLSYKAKIKKILDEVLIIIDKPMTSTEIYDDLVQFASSRGKSKLITLSDGSRVHKYIPNNPNEHVIVITDTLTNLTIDESIKFNSEKKECDLHSNNCKHIYRNMFHYSVVNVTHSNRDITNTMRTKSNEIYPHKNDISISSQPSRDADIVICLFNPYEYVSPNNSLSKFGGYNILRLQNRYRNIGVLKSRNGESMKRISVLFIGECGYFKALPKSTLMQNKDYANIESITVEYKPEKDHKTKSNKINNLKIKLLSKLKKKDESRIENTNKNLLNE